MGHVLVNKWSCRAICMFRRALALRLAIVGRKYRSERSGGARCSRRWGGDTWSCRPRSSRTPSARGREQIEAELSSISEAMVDLPGAGKSMRRVPEAYYIIGKLRADCGVAGWEPYIQQTRDGAPSVKRGRSGEACA